MIRGNVNVDVEFGSGDLRLELVKSTDEESIGIQGIVTGNKDGEITVNFPVAICGSYYWSYSEEELKLVKKG